jgi:hypothetical protein
LDGVCLLIFLPPPTNITTILIKNIQSKLTFTN